MEAIFGMSLEKNTIKERKGKDDIYSRLKYLIYNQSSQLAQFFTYKMELQNKQCHFKAPQVKSHDV